MKKILLIFGATALFSSLNAQTINSSNVVEYGDTIFNAIDNSPSISLGTTGTGNTWNFSTLIANSLDTNVFEHPFFVAGNAASTTFPYASLASKQDTNYIFLQKTSSALELLGLSNGTIHVASQDPETIITFLVLTELLLKDTAQTTTVVTGASVGQPLADSIKIISKTFIESDFDASGSLTTPFGAFSAIRQNLRRETKTDIYAKGTLTGGVYSLLSTQLDTAFSHQYWSDAANSKYPLVSYDLTAAGTLSGTVVWTMGFVELNNVSLNELENKTIKIFPNPVNNVITIDNDEMINTLIITDISGKMVYSTETNVRKKLNVDFLKEGVYILSITTDNYRGTTKFIKQ